MSVQFHDFGSNPLPDQTFDSETKLLEFFRQFKEPTSGELSHPNGFMLTVLLDGDLASVQYSDVEGDPPYLVAVSPVEIVQISHVFIVTTSDTEILGKFCLSFSVFESVVSYFFRTGQKIPTITWEEV